MDICRFFLYAYLIYFIFASSRIVISSLIFNKQRELLLLFHLSLVLPLCFHCLSTYMALPLSCCLTIQYLELIGLNSGGHPDTGSIFSVLCIWSCCFLCLENYSLQYLVLSHMSEFKHPCLPTKPSLISCLLAAWFVWPSSDPCSSLIRALSTLHLQLSKFWSASHPTPPSHLLLF